MRCFQIIVLLSFIVPSILAQSPPPLTFYGQPELERGISIEPYALFYENLSGDTTQPLLEVVQQPFILASSASDTKFTNNRQMKLTSQVIWLRFQIKNTHPADTLRLWYGGGPHAVISLYLKDNASFRHLSNGGICTVPVDKPLGPFALPLLIPPGTHQSLFPAGGRLPFTAR